MKFLRSIRSKQITATAFLALLLMIYGVKLFHTHKASVAGITSFYAHSAKDHVAAHKNTLAANCSICDFCFVRDADISAAGFTTQPPACGSMLNSSRLPFLPCSLHPVITDRGPPAT